MADEFLQNLAHFNYWTNNALKLLQSCVKPSIYNGNGIIIVTDGVTLVELSILRIWHSDNNKY